MDERPPGLAGSLPPRVTQIHMMGNFRLRSPAGWLDIPQGTQRLLAYVCVRHQAHRDAIAAALWPDSDVRRAAHSLRTELWQASRSCPGALTVRGEIVQVGESVDVDILAVTDRVRQLTLAPADVAVEDLLEISTDIELLVGWREEWVVVERERVRQRYLHYLEAASAELHRRRQYANALAAALAAVEIEPLRESAHRAAIVVHLAEGNLAEAVAQFERLERQLDEDLGIGPSPLIRQMIQDALAGRWAHHVPAPRRAAEPLLVVRDRGDTELT